MSFGSAAARRGRRPAPGDACPCGSGATFGSCCSAILDGAPASSPEALMRSRYTAFATRDVVHLERSWHPSTRPERLTLDDAVEWWRLVVIRSESDGARGTVEFRASWRDPSTAAHGEMHETSRFRRIDGDWFYLDGDVGS